MSDDPLILYRLLKDIHAMNSGYIGFIQGNPSVWLPVHQGPLFGTPILQMASNLERTVRR